MLPVGWKFSIFPLSDVYMEKQFVIPLTGYAGTKEFEA